MPPRIRPTAAALMLVILLPLVSCTPNRDNANGDLVNTSWTVVSINGLATIPQARPTMTFAGDGTVSGASSCNQYSGTYRMDGDRIAIGQTATTLILCDGQLGQQEVAFANGLTGATHWRHVPDGNLELRGAAVIIAGPGIAEGPPGAESGAGLAGTSWNLVALGNTADLARIVPTITFGADGTASGFSGCNTFSGTYTTEGNKLTLGPLATTKIGCERPASAVEAEVLAALSGVATWSIGGDGRLVLGGPVALTFMSG